MADPIDPKVAEAQARADALVRDLLSDPELGAQVRAKAKAKFPEANLEFPEDRFEPAMAPLRAQLEAATAAQKALEDKLAERDAKEAEKAVERQFTTSLESAREKYGLDDEGFNKALDRMRETKNYTDADAAAAWVAQNAPKPKATPPSYLGPQNINLFGSSDRDDKFELLHRDPMGKFLDAEFNEFYADPDKYVAEAFGQ